MRLLLITNVFPNPDQPNKGVFNLQLARALARGHEFRVISPISWVDEWRSRGNGTLGPERCQVVDGIEVHYPRYVYPPGLLRERYGWFFWRSLRNSVRRLLLTYQPDAVLGYWAHPDGEAVVRLAQRLSVPAVVMVGGSDVLLLAHQSRRRRRIQAVLQAAHAVVAVSEDLKEKVIGLGLAPDKVHVVYRGIDAERFSPGDRAEARRRLGLAAEGRVLLWVGRMVPVKGLDELMEACTLLRARGVEFRLYLVGDGPQRPALVAASATRGLTGVVTFAGAVAHDQLPDWYRAADLFVLPSHSEGVPNVLREALACGTPFVASEVGGIPELAAGGANRLVPPGNPAALAEAVAGALAEAGPVPVTSGRLTDWTESAEALLGIVRPLVAASQDEDNPWWASRDPAPLTPETKVSPWRWRQMVRRSLRAVLPRRLFLVRGPRASGAVCLTFDDGPHPRHTPRLLDVLKDQGVTATFFVVGRLAERYPDLVRRIATEGHALGIHSFYHTNLNLFSARQVIDCTRRAQDLFHRLTGQAPVTLYRPPRGKVSARNLLALWRAGQTVVLWNVDPRDYACGSGAELRGWFERHPLAGGDVVLLHDRLPHAAEALPGLVESVRSTSLTFTTVAQWVR
jgi:glycosyltransferase involved in cell wall biosynthesis/peptidoglycan/xylan/chitin deacetylase (PgdA/CDA1 family)